MVWVHVDDFIVDATRFVAFAEGVVGQRLVLHLPGQVGEAQGTLGLVGVAALLGESALVAPAPGDRELLERASVLARRQLQSVDVAAGATHRLNRPPQAKSQHRCTMARIWVRVRASE